jgi:hypothetical protein
MRCHSGGSGTLNRMTLSNTRSFSAGHNVVIRVYDEAGNVIRDARAHWRFQRAVSFFGSVGVPVP